MASRGGGLAGVAGIFGVVEVAGVGIEPNALPDRPQSFMCRLDLKQSLICCAYGFQQSCSTALLFKWEIFFDEVSQFLQAGMRFD